MESKAQVVWNGGLKDGSGHITTGSAVLKNVPYTFKTRFEGAPGTNPEELIAAAHSACFSMALGAELGKVKITPESIKTEATVTLKQDAGGFSISESRLVTVVSAPGADKADIEKAAASAKENCPVSKLLNAKVTLELTIQA